MTLKDLIRKLKGFECEALKDKEVVHRFVTKLGYGYKEVVQDVYFDAGTGDFVIITGREQEAKWDDKANVVLRETKK